MRPKAVWQCAAIDAGTLGFGERIISAM